MAFDKLRDLQEQLNKREADLQRAHVENARLSLAIQNDLNEITSKYQREQSRLQADINTAHNDLNTMQRDITGIQKKQTVIQTKITEYQKLQTALQKEIAEHQEQQTAIQNKMKEKQNRLGDYTKKMESLLRDQGTAEQRLRVKQRELEQKSNDTRTIERGVATLRANLAREMANAAKQNQANDSNRPGAASRPINGLRR